MYEHLGEADNTAWADLMVRISFTCNDLMTLTGQQTNMSPPITVGSAAYVTVSFGVESRTRTLHSFISSNHPAESHTRDPKGTSREREVNHPSKTEHDLDLKRNGLRTCSKILSVNTAVCPITGSGGHYHSQQDTISGIIINIIIGVPSLRRGWRPWGAIRFCQVPSHCTVPYSFSSSRSRCQSNSFLFVLCLFFNPPCPPTPIFVGNDAFLHFRDTYLQN